MIYVGIDPGVNGAVAILNGGSITVYDIPTQSAARGKQTAKRKEIDGAALWDLLRDVPADLVVIEQVGAMPRDGAVQAFAFGKSFGIICGVVCAMGARREFVTPMAWRKAMGIPKGDKAGDKGPSMRAASEMFPEQAHLWRAKCHADRAEAALIAAWAERTHKR